MQNISKISNPSGKEKMDFKIRNKEEFKAYQHKVKERMLIEKTPQDRDPNRPIDIGLHAEKDNKHRRGKISRSVPMPTKEADIYRNDIRKNWNKKIGARLRNGSIALKIKGDLKTYAVGMEVNGRRHSLFVITFF